MHFTLHITAHRYALLSNGVVHNGIVALMARANKNLYNFGIGKVIGELGWDFAKLILHPEHL